MRRVHVLAGTFLAAVVGASPAAAAPEAPPAPPPDDPAVTRVVDLTFPVAGDNHYTDSYTACRGGGGCPRLHKATDVMAAEGTAVHAAVGGEVRWITGLDGPVPSYGWMISIAGDDGLDYSYIHLGRQDGPSSGAYVAGLARGARVERGQLLGFVGCSGNASCDAPHLHFEIEDSSIATDDHYGVLRLNPYFSLRAAEGRGDLPKAADHAHPHQPAPGAQPWPFTDLAPTATHADEVMELFRDGVVEGCSDTEYCPGDQVSRGQAATMLMRALDLPRGRESFPDVAADGAHAEAIGAAAKAGILTGRADGRFQPGAPISRAQVASMLARAFDLAPGHGTVDFPDVPARAAHAEAIDAAVHAGVLTGRPDGTFRPAGATSRAQMAAVLARAGS